MSGIYIYDPHWFCTSLICVGFCMLIHGCCTSRCSCTQHTQCVRLQVAKGMNWVECSEVITSAHMQCIRSRRQVAPCTHHTTRGVCSVHSCDTATLCSSLSSSSSSLPSLNFMCLDNLGAICVCNSTRQILSVLTAVAQYSQINTTGTLMSLCGHHKLVSTYSTISHKECTIPSWQSVLTYYTL